MQPVRHQLDGAEQQASVRVRWHLCRGDRGTKSKPITGPHLVYGFRTTAPNAVVKPIHPTAMPVILTNNEACKVWIRAPCDSPYAPHRPFPHHTPDMVLR